MFQSSIRKSIKYNTVLCCVMLYAVHVYGFEQIGCSYVEDQVRFNFTSS
jgi:hypothetical protein